MKKHAVMVFLLMSVLITQCACGANAPVAAGAGERTYRVLRVDSDGVSAQGTDGFDQCAVETLNRQTLDDYDLYILDREGILELLPQTAGTIVDSGAVLCVETDEINETLDYIYELLEAEKTITLVTSGAAIRGVYVVRRQGRLVPGVLSEQLAAPEALPAANGPLDADAGGWLARLDCGRFWTVFFQAASPWHTAIMGRPFPMGCPLPLTLMNLITTPH